MAFPTPHKDLESITILNNQDIIPIKMIRQRGPLMR